MCLFRAKLTSFQLTNVKNNVKIDAYDKKPVDNVQNFTTGAVEGAKWLEIFVNCVALAVLKANL